MNRGKISSRAHIVLFVHTQVFVSRTFQDKSTLVAEVAVCS